MSSSVTPVDVSSAALASPSSTACSFSAEPSRGAFSCSARALVAADRPQCLEGFIERLVRPMLATRTVTEELQAVVGSDTDEWSIAREDSSRLSALAKATSPPTATERRARSIHAIAAWSG